MRLLSPVFLKSTSDMHESSRLRTTRPMVIVDGQLLVPWNHMKLVDVRNDTMTGIDFFEAVSTCVVCFYV